ncbi:hypothetical protein D3C87_1825350 [compost metagenome]
MANADTTKVMWMITYHFKCSGSTFLASMKMRSRWMDEIATIEAATFIFSDDESMVPNQLSFSLWSSMSSCETKFS